MNLIAIFTSDAVMKILRISVMPATWRLSNLSKTPTQIDSMSRVAADTRQPLHHGTLTKTYVQIQWFVINRVLGTIRIMQLSVTRPALTPSQLNQSAHVHGHKIAIPASALGAIHMDGISITRTRIELNWEKIIKMIQLWFNDLNGTPNDKTMEWLVSLVFKRGPAFWSNKNSSGSIS